MSSTKMRLCSVTLAASATLLVACPIPLGEGGPQRARVGPQVGAAPAAAGQGPPVAKVGELTLTTGDLEERINSQSPFVRARYTTDERKREFLDNQVRFEVLALEAFRRGFDKDPEVQDSLKKILVQKLTRQEFDGRVNLKDITAAEVKAYYDSHLEDYNKPEMVRASQIFVAFGADKAKARAKAEEARKKAADPAKAEDRELFRQLVLEYSEDETSKRTGGDLRYLSDAELQERFGPAGKEAVWGAEMNAVSQVIEGKEGFHVFKRTGTRKPIERSLDLVANQIKNVLYREKRTDSFQAFVEELKKEFGVTTWPERVKDVRVEQGPPTPGALGGGGGHEHAGHEHGDLALDELPLQAP
jgi:peptidyl-prolyl cis-trans isomerase C